MSNAWWARERKGGWDVLSFIQGTCEVSEEKTPVNLCWADLNSVHEDATTTKTSTHLHTLLVLLVVPAFITPHKTCEDARHEADIGDSSFSQKLCEVR